MKKWRDRLFILLLGILLGCGCTIGLGAAASRAIHDETMGQYMRMMEMDEDEVVWKLACLNNIAHIVMYTHDNNEVTGMGLCMALTPDGTPLRCED